MVAVTVVKKEESVHSRVDVSTSLMKAGRGGVSPLRMLLLFYENKRGQ
jgi:hypothetical protein